MIILGYFALIVNVMSLCLVDYLRPLVGGVSKTVFQVLGRSRSGSVCVCECVCNCRCVCMGVCVCDRLYVCGRAVPISLFADYADTAYS